MMRNSKLSTEPEAKRPALILRCEKFNNFIAWKHEQMEQCAVEYGFQANVMKTGVAYMPRPVVESDYMPAVSIYRSFLGHRGTAGQSSGALRVS
jgi:hypothetical protein